MTNGTNAVCLLQNYTQVELKLILFLMLSAVSAVACALFERPFSCLKKLNRTMSQEFLSSLNRISSHKENFKEKEKQC